MEGVKSITLTSQQKQEIVRIWNSEYPVGLQYADMQGFEQYLSKLSNTSHYLLLADQGSLAGWLSVFTRDDERWFAMIVDSDFQKMGVGQRLLSLAKKDECILNGWVIDTDSYVKSNGHPYISPLPFYLKNDFELLPDTRLETKVLSAVKVQWKRA